MKTSPAASVSRPIKKLLRAFSDPTRLRILHLLQRGEVCVGDLVKILRISQPRVSRHLAALRQAGLVEVRKSGLWCHYSLAPAKSAFHKHLYECVAAAGSEFPMIGADTARASRVLKAGGCCPDER